MRNRTLLLLCMSILATGCSLEKHQRAQAAHGVSIVTSAQKSWDTYAMTEEAAAKFLRRAASTAAETHRAAQDLKVYDEDLAQLAQDTTRSKASAQFGDLLLARVRALDTRADTLRKASEKLDTMNPAIESSRAGLVESKKGFAVLAEPLDWKVQTAELAALYKSVKAAADANSEIANNAIPEESGATVAATKP